jgi:glycosyltransferase involved in cell wall biosynthesis
MTDAMRLLIVSDSYPPLIGGADLQAQMIAAAMARAGHRVDVATPWQPGLAEREDDEGVAVRRIRPLTTRLPWFSRDPRQRHHPPVPDPATTLELARIIRRRRPDLVHSYGWITYSAAAALLGTRVPLLVSARDYGYICGVRNYLQYPGAVCSGPALAKCLGCATATYAHEAAGNAVMGRRTATLTVTDRLTGGLKGLVAVAGIRAGEGLLRRRIRALHSNSRFVRAQMDRHLVRQAPGAAPIVDVVIPSFLPPEERGEPDASALARLPDAPFILFVGALLPQKGIWPLLEAYPRLRAPAPPLVLLGPSSYKSPTTFPPGVVVLGAASHATVMAAWDRALFGVVPSVGAETFGNVATEAMSRGRPIVGSRLGGLLDIVVDGESGLLVTPSDAAALAAAMQRLVDDPADRERLGEAARRRVERFSAASVVPQFEALYREVVARWPVRGRAADADGMPT